MKTAYFTFGQSHVHRFNGTVFDKDVVLKVTAPDPRHVMAELFDSQWAFEYEHPPNMSYFPRGIYELDLSSNQEHIVSLPISDEGFTEAQFHEAGRTISPEALTAQLVQLGLHPDFMDKFISKYEEWCKERITKQN